MEFITMVHPGDKDSAKLKRRAHSHAARVAHARARRLRTQEHEEENAAITGRVEPESVSASSRHCPSASEHTTSAAQSIPATVSGAFEHEPLASFLSLLSSKELFMFHYYTNIVFPRVRDSCPIVNYIDKDEHYIRDNWILLGSIDVDFLNGFLLAACRHLSIVEKEKEYAGLAIEYKLRNIRGLRESILGDSLTASRSAVTRALVLACDDLMIQDALAATNHVLGAVQIIRAAGGLEALGLNEIVRYVLHGCVYGKGLLNNNPLQAEASECLRL
ncbi:hypothetical protein C8034_v002283 [Colletotrichum sidae]|uniref:Uncharacterized protein n=1 Tax=Colletotrichum sidae TaxID=1347389 RepID=A0A4R8TDQ4_9PEZI|nr:hypothetical protein C8034_v002283 [Colletotrichum sidae]